MSRLKKESQDTKIALDKKVELLKEDLQGEYNAIELYNKHIEQIDVLEIKELLTHIRDEEQHHVEELTKLINKYI